MTNLSIPDMSCGHCKAAVLKTVNAAAPNASMDIDLQARTAKVQAGENLAAVLKALADQGYPATVLD